MATLAEVVAAVRSLETGILSELRGLSTVLQASVGKGGASGGKQPESEQFTDRDNQKFNLSSIASLLPASIATPLRQLQAALANLQGWQRMLGNLMGGQQGRSPTTNSVAGRAAQAASAPKPLAQAASVVVNTTAAVVVNAQAKAAQQQQNTANSGTGPSEHPGPRGSARASGLRDNSLLDDAMGLQSKPTKPAALPTDPFTDPSQVQDALDDWVNSRSVPVKPPSVAAAGSTAARTTPASVAANAASRAASTPARATGQAAGAGAGTAGAAPAGAAGATSASAAPAAPAGAAAAAAGATGAGTAGAAGAAGAASSLAGLAGPIGAAIAVAAKAAQKAKQIHDDPVESLKDDIKTITGPAGQLAFGLVDLTKHVEGHSRAVLESQRSLAEFSAGMAAVFAQSDVRKIMREREVGDRTAGTAKKLADSVDDLSDSMKETRILVNNIQNLVASGFATLVEPIAAGINVISGSLNEAIAWAMGQSQSTDITMGQWLAEVSRDARERPSAPVRFRN